ncbi:bifunctional folylpolyglutamate synthase/dihydrofolate synthase [Bacillus sp. FJAT-49732]|uniref:Dihydrofolate synthase/folylpolyglutamate synthase n=1 Tax=Lederbergia citrisecunda TaxID=2833583 RepID=A0A942TN90_9BACI|nr:folylpolyglutamate synthase/dihydrofolate synthase family protein [Lederbergia citrisecunda]MBS4199827.1 bifunctional folylpolyglutamate synthase/dihydrofolate synthase [Lederbergia citrisecunda]
MFNTYQEAIDWIHSRLRFGIKPGLKRMEWMLDKLGNPEKELKAIHVGGTNGKGSTVSYIRSMLIEAGYEVGTFTSPYIEQFNERISLNGKPIKDEEITLITNVIKPLADELEHTELGAPTEFEIITAMAFYYFARVHPVDFAVIEVGLGGRFDSTNVIEPLVSIITNIGMDHTQILGNTVKDIAFEKAGIIKKNKPLITCVKDHDALDVIKQAAIEKHSEMMQIDHEFFVTNYCSIESGERFTYVSEYETFNDLELSLVGKHQTENAAGAVAAVSYLMRAGYAKLDEEEIRRGLKKAYWPGRFEILQASPAILIDGAHNPEGLRAFASALTNRYKEKKIKIVFAALKDKDLTEMFTILEGIDAELYFTEFDFPRAAKADELKAISGVSGVKTESDWQKLIEELTISLKSNEVLAITGSLYFISAIKSFLVHIIKK